MRQTEAFRDIIYLGVQSEYAADGTFLSASSFVDQIFHFGDRLQVGIQVRGQAKCKSQIACRVSVYRDDILSALGIDVREERGQCSLADATFSGNCDFRHDVDLPQHCWKK